MRRTLLSVSVELIVLSSLMLAQVFIAQGGDAIVTRTNNLGGVQEASGNVDVTRYGNLVGTRLIRNNADITRYNNIAAVPLGVINNLSVNITVISADQDGNPQSTFLRGQIVEFAVTVVNNGTLPLTSSVLSVIILDRSSTIVFLSYSLETLRPGEAKSEVVGYLGLPSALAGDYTAKLSLFTNWPSAGGIGLASTTARFQVV